MLKAIKVILAIFFVLLALYVVPPSPSFPKPLPGSLQSKEPADSESPLRRAYFTNFTREEVMNYYKDEFTRLSLFNISISTYRLNYPPEDAQTLIRDQTRSTFLEEIVHPLRESVYINGFEPKDPKDAINIAGLPWRQKIIVKYVPSSIFVRLTVVVLSALASFMLLEGIIKTFKFPRKDSK